MSEEAEPARLGLTSSDGLFLGVVGIVVGALAGWLVPLGVDWAEGRGLPVPGPLQFLTAFDDTWLTWGRPVILALVGLAFALVIFANSPVLYVGREEVVVRKGGDRRHISRDSVAGIHRESGKLTIETKEGRQLFHGDVEGTRDEVRKAFLDRGYPYES